MAGPDDKQAESKFETFGMINTGLGFSVDVQFTKLGEMANGAGSTAASVAGRFFNAGFTAIDVAVAAQKDPCG